MKKLLSLFTALALTLSMAATMPVVASAASIKDVWSINRTDPEEEKTGNAGNYSSEYSVDTSVYHGSSRYSIKIKNNDYNATYVEKTYDVEPFTTYKFSAWVKYSGYKLDPNAVTKESGACVAKAFSWDFSKFSKSKNWVKVEYTFTTADETKFALCLQNGKWDSKCKGTAYFSDIKLEKAELTNKWNVLAVIYRNIDTKIKVNGKTKKYKASMTDGCVKDIKSTLNKLYDSFEKYSDGLMDIKDIDVIIIDEPVKDFVPYNYGGDSHGVGTINGWRSNETADEVYEKLSKKQYNHIYSFVPSYEMPAGYAGISGFLDNYTNTQIPTVEDSYGTLANEATLIHEAIHGLEHFSKIIKPNTMELHTYFEDSSIDTPEEKLEWYSKYMQNTFPGDKGLDPSVFYRASGKWELVSNDMTTGTGITLSESSRIDISKCKVAKISSKTYSGKKKTPAPVITDGKYKLIKGKDYTVKYSNNVKVGKAKITITGKGIYKGTITAEFNIVKKK